MCVELKYGIWKCAQPQAQDVNELVRGGFSPLTAMVLAGRGMADADQARRFLSCNRSLPDPMLLNDMDKAVRRVRQALENHEKIAAILIGVPLPADSNIVRLGDGNDLRLAFRHVEFFVFLFEVSRATSSRMR